MGKSLIRYIAVAIATGMLAFGLFGCAGQTVDEPAPPVEGTDGGSGAPGGGTDTVEIDDNTTDQMWDDFVAGAEFYVFAFDGTPLTVDHVYPVDIYAEEPLEDGHFYKVVADVTYLNGGVGGYVDFPEVESVTSCTEVSPFDIGLKSIMETPYGLTLIGDYADGDILLQEIGIYAVWKDGAWTWRYDKSINLPDGTRALARSDVDEADVQAGIENGVLSCEEYFALPAD